MLPTRGYFAKRPIVVSARRLSQRMSIRQGGSMLNGTPGDWLVTDAFGRQSFLADERFRAEYEYVTPQPGALYREADSASDTAAGNAAAGNAAAGGSTAEPTDG